MMAYDFSTITEVQLAQGSHANAREGLCFMEMVAWFAGEQHSDKPACACDVLGAYGIALNDRMPDALRDELLKPLVPLIAGTRGDAEDRRKRAYFLASWTVKMVLPIALRAAGLHERADACAAKAAAPTKAAAANAADAADAAAYAAKAAAADAAAAAKAADAADAADAQREVFAIAVEGLRQAIQIGPHEGFALTIDLPARHVALRDLVAA